MRKILFGVIPVIVILALIFIPVKVFADDSSGENTETVPPMPPQFYSWEMITTYTGCLSLTILMTQFFKPLWPSRVKTQYLSYICAVLLLDLANLVLDRFSWPSFGWNFLNGLVISFAANGGYNNFKETVNDTEIGDVSKNE